MVTGVLDRRTARMLLARAVVASLVDGVPRWCLASGYAAVSRWAGLTVVDPATQGQAGYYFGNVSFFMRVDSLTAFAPAEAVRSPRQAQHVRTPLVDVLS